MSGGSSSSSSSSSSSRSTTSSAPSSGLPQALVAQFRAVSLERLERIERAWSSLTQRVATPETEAELVRDIHTLKGEARLVGFADVALITQRFEDLVYAARRRRYRVHEDVDVVVTMAIQFIRMLLRKRVGASQGGIDLDGFLQHIDDVLNEWPRHGSDSPDSADSGSAIRSIDGGKLSLGVRQRLGVAAAQVFVESVAAPERAGLRRAWEILVTELAQLDAVLLMPLVRRHATAAKDIADELGKEVDVVIEGDADVRVGVEVLDSIHSALLHTLRNAVDHGIELPDERASRGKSRRGTISVRIASGEHENDVISVVVHDDGAGADFELIRRRAIELGLLAHEEKDGGSGGACTTDAKLLDFVFAPGFSVRESASAISGRGIGLDAVRATIERLRGTLVMETNATAGTTVTMRIPQSSKVIDVHCVASTRAGVMLAIPTTWTCRSGDRSTGAAVVDPLRALSIPPNGEPRNVHVLIFAREGEEHVVAVGGPVKRASAVRICPTPSDDPYEIVQIKSPSTAASTSSSAEQHAILVRPEVLFTLTEGG